MFTIQTYTDTKCELEMARTRLNKLLFDKEKLYTKYFPLVQQLKDDVIENSYKNNDKMADYVHELHEIDWGTGKSLADEIEYQQENVKKLENYINNMNNILSKMTGLEYQLFYEIAVRGINISKAVSNISERNNIDNSTIWRKYYPKIKYYVKKLSSPIVS